MPLQSILSTLADSQPHHVTELAHLCQRSPQQLNALWQQTPPHIRGLLRQHDGFWRLVRPLAMISKDFSNLYFQTQILSETTSSNDELMQMVKNQQDIHRQVVVAYSQTQGRGRQGKAWENRLGECLMLSVGWRFEQQQNQLGALALMVALACQRALEDYHVQIKWPNDLVVGLDKLGGILIETVRQNQHTYAIIGIGINFVLPKNIENATSLQKVGCKRTADAILTDILNQLHYLLSKFEKEGFIPRFRMAYERAHRDQNEEIILLENNELKLTGRVLGVGLNGELRVQTTPYESEDGQWNAGIVHEIVGGEISLRRPEQLKSPEKIPAQYYLLLDGGNSRLKWAWIQNGEILSHNHAQYRDLHNTLRHEWERYRQEGEHIRVVGSAVCGETKRAMVESQLPQAQVEWLSSMKNALGIYNHYQNIDRHGADRWFNALGSRRFTQNACVVVSCGTAVTIDALTAENHYLGGTIMPGLNLMREALTDKTAQLNQPVGKFFPFPTTTANAIASGILDAICGAIMLMHARLKERNDGEITEIMITGGGASKIASALPETFTLDNPVKIVDNLVILGLLYWIEQSEKSE